MLTSEPFFSRNICSVVLVGLLFLISVWTMSIVGPAKNNFSVVSGGFNCHIVHVGNDSFSSDNDDLGSTIHHDYGKDVESWLS